MNAHSRRGRELFREAARLLEQSGIRLLGKHAIREAARLAPAVREAVEGGAPMVIVGGGDGSVSSAVDAVVGRDCVFALLPLGTANSFARTLGIPLDLPGAVAAIAQGRRRRVDLGVINGDHFANFATIGFGPVVSATVPRSWKKALGRVGYLLWAATRLPHFEPFQVTVTIDGERHQFPALELRIANGSFHGGIELVHAATVDSGDIVVEAVTGRARHRLPWNWFATVLGLRQSPDITRVFRAPRMQVETEPPLPISIDGEVHGATPALVEVAAGAIEVAVPAAGST